MEKIQEEVCASAILSIGTYSISIKSGELSYSIPPDIRGEPVLLLWIHGGTFINKKSNVKFSETWSYLNGYEDKLLLEVLETTNISACFFGLDASANLSDVTLSINKIGTVGKKSLFSRNGTGSLPQRPVNFFPSTVKAQKLDDGEIYQRIWNNDENKFSVSPRNEKGEWEDENADILLDEQVKAGGKREIDLATRPLFYRVNESKLFDERTTYVSFISLLDNYAIRSLDPEFTTEEEAAEQERFLSLILPTKPMKIAWEYINKAFCENLSEGQFYQVLYRLWFELYTNYYKGKSTHYCSGFEHVFVGEGKYDIRVGSKKQNLGKVSGYHSWVKFYLDEKNQRVNYLGYKYDLKGDDGPNNPNVVTLQQLHNVTNMRGEVIAQLFKSKGGFFVGPSPECEIAMATVAFYESLHGKIRDQRRVKINGANYNIVLYRNINTNGSRGDFIRSFFPIFLGLDKFSNQEKPSTDEPVTTPPIVKPIENDLTNDGIVIIVSALPNPRGVDEGDEWVELQNNTNQAIDLTGWQLFDKLERPQALKGIITAKGSKRFYIHRTHPDSMQLVNKSGVIILRDQQSQLIAGVKYHGAHSDEVIRFDE
ncbi:MAG: lamin tail domain-containing protein [Richelia sp.]|nr:lamin tail domain-containing protein [Richelia sp.]